MLPFNRSGGFSGVLFLLVNILSYGRINSISETSSEIRLRKKFCQTSALQQFIVYLRNASLILERVPLCNA